MKESVVEIPPDSGNKYRYSYDPETKKTSYVGPVGTAPALSEEDFLRHMEQPTIRFHVFDWEYIRLVKNNNVRWLTRDGKRRIVRARSTKDIDVHDLLIWVDEAKKFVPEEWKIGVMQKGNLPTNVIVDASSPQPLVELVPRDRFIELMKKAGRKESYFFRQRDIEHLIDDEDNDAGELISLED